MKFHMELGYEVILNDLQINYTDRNDIDAKLIPIKENYNHMNENEIYLVNKTQKFNLKHYLKVISNFDSKSSQKSPISPFICFRRNVQEVYDKLNKNFNEFFSIENIAKTQVKLIKMKCNFQRLSSKDFQ